MAETPSSSWAQTPSTTESTKTIQIHIKQLNGETISLTVSPTLTISSLRSMLANHSSTSSPSTTTTTTVVSTSSSSSPPPSPSLLASTATTATTQHPKENNITKASEIRLAFASKHLNKSSRTLQDYSIQDQSTLHLVLPSRKTTTRTVTGSTTRSSGSSTPTGNGNSNSGKKQRCTFKECRDAAQRIVGDCGFCGGRFCGRHRLLEDHRCVGLEDCKKESHEANADKLISERTMAIKGI